MAQQAQKKQSSSSVGKKIMSYLLGIIVALIILYFISVAIINAWIERTVKQLNEAKMRNSSPPLRI